MGCFGWEVGVGGFGWDAALEEVGEGESGCMGEGDEGGWWWDAECGWVDTAYGSWRDGAGVCDVHDKGVQAGMMEQITVKRRNGLSARRSRLIDSFAEKLFRTGRQSSRNS